MKNEMIAAAIAQCNTYFGTAAAAFNQLGAMPDNLSELDKKYRLAQSVKPEDPLSMIPMDERREYLLLVAQQSSLAAIRGYAGVVNALVREREAEHSGKIACSVQPTGMGDNLEGG